MAHPSKEIEKMVRRMVPNLGRVANLLGRRRRGKRAKAVNRQRPPVRESE
jgi:hypothetical protein